MQFVRSVEPRLRRALLGVRPPGDVPDALSEAFAFAWEHWPTVQSLDNPVGYLFRVAQSRSRVRRQGRQLAATPAEAPDVEPGLSTALRALPRQQRTAVWLVHACQFTYSEAAEAMGISPSAVGTHLQRALERLRTALGARHDT